MPDFNSELALQVNMVNLPLLKIRAKKAISPMSPQCVAFTNKKGTFQLARSDTKFHFVTKIREQRGSFKIDDALKRDHVDKLGKAHSQSGP